jgi:hypothetical protein
MLVLARTQTEKGNAAYNKLSYAAAAEAYSLNPKPWTLPLDPKP